MKNLNLTPYLNYLLVGGILILIFLGVKTIKNVGFMEPAREKATIKYLPDGKVTGKLNYNPDWAYQNDASNNNFEQWFDGKITNSTPGTPTSSGLKNFLDPTRTYFTFPSALNFNIEKIKLYDGEGRDTNPLKIILLLKDGKEVSDVVPDFYGIKYQEWHEHEIPKEFSEVKAIIFEKHGRGPYPNEIEFVGTYDPYKPNFPPVTRVKLKNMYGVNSFPWNNSGKLSELVDPDVKSLLSRYNAMSWNRAYDDWPLFDDGSGEYRFAPTFTGSWNQDRGFERLQNKGINNIQCIKNLPYYLLARYPQSIGSDGTTDSRRTERNGEAAYHQYKGNLVEYVTKNDFPKSGETSKLRFKLNSGDEPLMFPYSLEKETFFVAKDSQLVYRWNGSSYELLTDNVPGVYFDIFTEADADKDNPIGKLKTKFNDLCTSDRSDPSTYIEYAKMAFQSAARYGKNKSLDPSLILTPDKKIGLNLIAGVEAGNELNAHWHGRRRYLSPYEQAALLSAFYDGHMGTMGNDVGVKNADPDLKVFNGGIVSASPSFFRAMIDWCEKNRGYREDGSINICWDVQKYHQYTNSKGLEQHTDGERHAMPADMVPTATQRIAKIKNMNYELLGRHLDLHVGEWGYDIGGSRQGAKEIINNETKVHRSSRQTAGDWIVRDQLEYCWYGMDAMQIYLLEDPSHYEGQPEDFGNLYATSGLFNRGDKEPSREARPAAWFSQQLMNHFGEFTPVARLSEDPRVQKHLDDDGNSMYAIWVPDMVGRKEKYNLKLPDISSINVYSLVEGSDKMKKKAVKINGEYNITAGETPIFVEVPVKKKVKL